MGYFDEPELTPVRWMKKAGITAAISAAWMSWLYKNNRAQERYYCPRRRKFSSREVEDILLQHPKIHDACWLRCPMNV